MNATPRTPLAFLVSILLLGPLVPELEASGKRGVVLETHAIDSDANGRIDNRFMTTTTYDEHGRVVRKVDEVDEHANGVIGGRHTFTCTYNAGGNPLEQVFESDSKADGIIEIRRVVISTYDSRGNLVRQTEEQRGGDWYDEYRRTSTWRFDEHGRLIQQGIVDDDGSAVVTETFAYDEHGNLLERVKGPLSRPDGTIVFNERRVSSYDRQDRQVSQVIELDPDRNGVIDYRYTDTFSYEGNVVRFLRLNDTGADGIIETRETGTSEYDQHGNRVQVMQEWGYGADGRIYYRHAGRWTYDPHDRVVREEIGTDSHSTGIIDSWSTDTFEYDEHGNLVQELHLASEGRWYWRLKFSYDQHGNVLEEVVETDDGADGTVEIRYTYSNSYDQRGNLVHVVNTSDFSDGRTDHRSTIRTSYDQQGNPLQQVSERDAGANGTIEWRETVTYGYGTAGHSARTAASMAAGITGTGSGLQAALPNPFQDRATLRFLLAEPGLIELRVFDVHGRLVRTLAKGQHAPGEHRVVWDGTDITGRSVPNGAYFARLSVGNLEFSRVLVKAR